MGQEVLVECDVFEGMFSDEAVVEVADQSYIVPKDQVTVGTDRTKGRVRARLVGNAEEKWIVLPTNYSDSIPAARAKVVKE
jgi:hypothetical protein